MLEGIPNFEQLLAGKVNLAERTDLPKEEELESGTLNPDASSEGPPTDVFNPSDKEIKEWGDQIDKNITLAEEKTIEAGETPQEENAKRI